MLASPMPRSGPLSNVVVVDLTRQLAGPQASRILCDLGARVIKVEQVGSTGDLIEASPHYFATVNHSKERVELDLRSQDGRVQFEALLAFADVLTENFRPGVMAEMGWGWETLHARFPRLIMASVSGFGQTGPLSTLPAMDVVIQAMSGIMSITGYKDRPGVGAGAQIADVSAGMMAANGIMAALWGRDGPNGSGEGCYVDVAMLDVMAVQLAGITARFKNGSLKQPVREGSSSRSGAPFDTYAASDGELALIGLQPHFWRAICEVLEVPEMLANPRYATPRGRREAYDVFKPELERALSRRTVQEWCELLQARGVPCGAVADLETAVSNVQLQHRGMFPTTADGTFVVGNSIKLSSYPQQPTRPFVAERGEHTVAVQAQLAKL